MIFDSTDILPYFETAGLDLNKYLVCDYTIETCDHPRTAAVAFCQELSTAQYKRPNIAEDLRPEFAAKVMAIKVIRESSEPQIRFADTHGHTFSLCQLTIAYPIVHFDDSIPVMLSALAGEGAFYSPGLGLVRLTDVQYPSTFLAKFLGPRWGIQGLRKQLHVNNRPFFVGVVKPNLGLSPQDFAQIAHQAWLGGLDIAKDDEMLVNPVYSPLSSRMTACTELARDVQITTGRLPMMVANITAEIDAIKNLYNQAKQSGATAVMLNPYFTGFSALRSLRNYSELPLWGHFTGMALYDRIPGFGIEGKVLVKLQRLLGCDVIVMPGFGERMHATDAQVLSNIKACLEDMGNIKPCLAIPGGSDWAGTLPTMYEKIGHTNFGLIAGRGVFSHPQGPQAGAKSLHDAWHAMQNGTALSEFSQVSPELAQAMETFGKA